MSARVGGAPWLLLIGIVASLSACTPPAQPMGGNCVFNDECAAPLVCAGHRCRAPCRDARDCSNGWFCVYADQWDQRVCMPPDEPIPCLTTRGCPEPWICGSRSYCQLQCRSNDDCTVYVSNSTCLVGVGSDAGAQAGGTCSFHPAVQDAGTD